jgi:acyl dehydratase
MKSKKAAKLKYKEIEIGSIYQFKRKFSEDDLSRFADLTGDYNPLHLDKNYARKSKFSGNIVYGMLAGSLFSKLVGMHCPGERCLYLGQTLFFKKPIYPGDELTVKGTVLDKSDSLKIIRLKTEVLKAGDLVISGEARVSFLE